MGLVTLSNNDRDELLQLSDSLDEIRAKKESIIEKIEPYYKRMEELLNEESILENQYEQLFINKESEEFKTNLDARKLSEIVTKQSEIEEEKENINIISKDLYEQLSEILSQEEDIVNKIKILVSETPKEKENTGIYVNTLGTTIQISDFQIDDSDMVDLKSNEIIRCKYSIQNKITDSFSKNITSTSDKKTENDYSYYEKLEKLFLENKTKSEVKTDESGISFVQRSYEVKSDELDNNYVQTNQDIKLNEVDNNFEGPIQNDINIRSNVEPEVNENEENTKIEDNSYNNVLPLDSILNDEVKLDNPSSENMLNNNIQDIINNNLIQDIPDNNSLNNETKPSEQVSEVFINAPFNNQHSKVANTNRKKLGVIENNFKGTYPDFKIVNNIIKVPNSISNFLGISDAA